MWINWIVHSKSNKKNKNLSTKIVSSNRSDLINKKVIELKIVDDSNSDTKKMVEGSDLIIIATPLSSYEDIILKIKDSLKNGSILTDVGSVKENVIGLIEKKCFQKCFLDFFTSNCWDRRKRT